jgi:hypothetical protein
VPPWFPPERTLALGTPMIGGLHHHHEIPSGKLPARVSRAQSHDFPVFKLSGNAIVAADFARESHPGSLLHTT